MSAYELDEVTYKGFKIRIVNDESPEEPDWGGEDVFLVRGDKCRWNMGRKNGHRDPFSFLPWGEGPWAEYDHLLRAAKVDTPPDDWKDDEDWEKRACWEAYREWRESHSTDYIVWPYNGVDAHGPGTFTFYKVEADDRYYYADCWVFVKDTRTDVERLADVGKPREQVDPEALRDSLLKQYRQWANGDVWGYIIEDSSGDEIDSCWGFYGDEYCLQAAKESADHYEGQKMTHFVTLIFEDGTWGERALQVPTWIGDSDIARWVLDNAELDPQPLAAFSRGDGARRVLGGVG